MQEIKDVVTWLESWFARKGDETRSLSAVVSDLSSAINGKVSSSQGNENASKNVVTNSSGVITTEPKINVSNSSGLSLNSSTQALSHSNSVVGGALSTSSAKKIKHDVHGHITETENLYSTDIPISSTDSTKISAKISSIDSAISDLQSFDFIVVTDTKPTASASTMNKLYVVSETDSNNNNVVNVYYTKRTGTSPNYSYALVKMDTNILDELSIEWSEVKNKPTFSTVATSGSYNDLSNKPSNTSDFTNDGSDGYDTYVESGDLSAVATSGSYNDLSNKPNIPTDVSDLTDTSNTTFTPKSHTHGQITNDGKVGSNANYFITTTTGGAVTSKQKIGNIDTNGAIGSTSGKPIITTTNGALTTGNFGTSSGTFAEGNHTHSDKADVSSISDIGFSGDYDDLNSFPVLKISPTFSTYSNLAIVVNTGLSTSEIHGDCFIIFDMTDTYTQSLYESYAIEFSITDSPIEHSSQYRLKKPNGTTVPYRLLKGENDIVVYVSSDYKFTLITPFLDVPSHSHGNITENGIITYNGNAQGLSLLISDENGVIIPKQNANDYYVNHYGTLPNLELGSQSNSQYDINMAVNGKIGQLISLSEFTSKKRTSTTSWNTTPSDSYYASEKLIKDSLDLKSNIGDCVTSIVLVPKGNDPNADAYNGVIRLYFGDEPSS